MQVILTEQEYNELKRGPTHEVVRSRVADEFARVFNGILQSKMCDRYPELRVEEIQEAVRQTQQIMKR